MVPFFDYLPEYDWLHDEIDDAVSRVVRSGRLVLGPEVEAFEAEFAAYCGLEHGVGVASGTDALALALRALAIGSGDEVITVANAGAPTVAAIRSTGATPRFVDVDPDSLLLNPDLLEQALRPSSRCVLPVHLYGQPAPMDPIRDFARAHDLALIEDCAQAHGARYRDRAVGHAGSIACFSFYPTKNLGAFGDGGLCATDDAELARRLRMLRTYGFAGDRHSHIEGLNSRLDELQAAILRVKLKHLDSRVAERRRIAARYLAGLAGSPLTPVAEQSWATHAYHLFVVRASDREAVGHSLDAAEVSWLVHYPVPVHRMAAYRFLGYSDGALPVTENASDTVLSLPLYPGLEESAQDRVLAALRTHCG